MRPGNSSKLVQGPAGDSDEKLDLTWRQREPQAALGFGRPMLEAGHWMPMGEGGLER